MKLKSTILALAAGFLSLGANKSFAAEGDTTIVISHNTQILDWYGNFDSLATFPDHSVTYRKIYMEFELGKYHCEGYNPSNPGEGEGQTGWCGDWDYDVHILAMTADGDTIELGELITPYANSNFPATAGWDWKHPYLFDVTDYYPILKNDVTIRIFYSGYSGGFTGTVKFYFIEGTPAREVVHIEKLYHGSYAYGLADDPIEDKVSIRTISFPADATSGVLRTIISGHGGIADENCAEFCNKWLKYFVNDNEILQRDIWRDDCGYNWLAVQSGTWVYNRGNWCPGNVVEPWIVPLPEDLSPGSDFTADIDFEPFSTSHSGASYKMSTYAIFYGPYAHELDLAIEDIISPNQFIEKRQSNPVCGEAKFRVKNYGSTSITSFKVAYQIGSGAVLEKEFTTDLAPDAVAEFTIEDFEELTSVTGTQTFHLQILEVNGTAGDDEPFNNSRSSTFQAAPVHTNDVYHVQLKTSGATSSVNPVTWSIVDISTGEIIHSRTATVANTTFRDTMVITNGCYKLVTETPYNLGLAFFSSFAGGHVRLYNAENGARIPVPGNDMANPGLEGNFGRGYTYYFSVNSPNSIPEIETSGTIRVYPNPAQDYFIVSMTDIADAELQVFDLLGKKVLIKNLHQHETRISIQDLPAGVYLVQIRAQDKIYQEKVSIGK